MPGILITANRQDGGVAVWLTTDFTKAETRSRAGIFDADAVQTARHSAAGDQTNNFVTAIYEVIVDEKADVSPRETIRANRGPTIGSLPERHQFHQSVGRGEGD